MAAPTRLLLALTFLGFISLGLPDALNGVLWPSVSASFGLPLENLGFLLVFFTGGYLTASLSIARLLRKFGVGGLLAASCGLVILSLCTFAFAPSWPWYLSGSVLAGLGAGAIDTALNAFAARRFSAKHMAWLHACWGIGATSGAMIATAVLARNLPWPWVFGIIAMILTPITITFVLVRRLWDEEPEAETDGSKQAQKSAGLLETLRHPMAWLQGLIFFFYVGAESILGQWGFTLLSQYRGFSEGAAGLSVSLYWTSLTLGRFALGFLADKWGVKRLLKAAVTSSFLGTLLFSFAPWPWLNAAGIMIVGASLAPIYPGMMSQTPERMGRFAESTIGFQVAVALIGAVTIPSFGGVLIPLFGLPALNALPVFLLFLLGVSTFILFEMSAEARTSPPPPKELKEGEDFYLENGLIVFTAKYHLDRGSCCGSGCRHCPYRSTGSETMRHGLPLKHGRETLKK